MEQLIDDEGNPYYSLNDDDLEGLIEQLTGKKPEPLSDAEIADIINDAKREADKAFPDVPWPSDSETAGNHYKNLIKASRRN